VTFKPPLPALTHSSLADGRVVFVTGGAGTICSAQTRAMVALGANACIIGRNQQKTESVAADISTARKGSKVLGIGGCDVRDVRAFPFPREPPPPPPTDR
jgi:NAD(P)-dependent dehydrogenase (short-subunit alcohol dehydrogenase family)